MAKEKSEALRRKMMEETDSRCKVCKGKHKTKDHHEKGEEKEGRKEKEEE